MRAYAMTTGRQPCGRCDRTARRLRPRTTPGAVMLHEGMACVASQPQRRFLQQRAQRTESCCAVPLAHCARKGCVCAMQRAQLGELQPVDSRARPQGRHGDSAAAHWPAHAGAREPARLRECASHPHSPPLFGIQTRAASEQTAGRGPQMPRVEATLVSAASVDAAAQHRASGRAAPRILFLV